MRLSCCAALALLLCAPAVAALDSVEMSFPVGFARLHLKADVTLDGDTSQAIREAADQYVGNHDGYAAQGEVDALVASQQGTIAAAAGKRFQGGNTTLDGHPPDAVANPDVRMSGAEGSTSSREAMVVHLSLDLDFTPASGSTHTLLLRHDATNGTTADLAFVLTAPEGFVVKGHSGLPGTASVTQGGTVLDFVAHGSLAGDAVITFGVPEKARAPGTGIVLLPTLAALALLRRPA